MTPSVAAFVDFSTTGMLLSEKPSAQSCSAAMIRPSLLCILLTLMVSVAALLAEIVSEYTAAVMNKELKYIRTFLLG